MPLPEKKPVRSTKATVVVLPLPDNGKRPQPPQGSALRSCRPCEYLVEDYRQNIIMAARQGRSYRSIAAQYGISALSVWKIVCDGLAVQRRAA